MVLDTELKGEDQERDSQGSIPENPAVQTPELNGEDLDTQQDVVVEATETITSEWDRDAGNPRNWSFSKRVFHTAIPALYGFIVTVATSAYVPAIPLVMKEFNVVREIAVLPLSLYTLGFIVGPILAAPLSELYGRRSVYWTTLPLLLIFTAISGASNNIPLLIVARLLAGIGGSGTLAVGAGTIADLWDRQKHGGRAALSYIIAPFLGPALGPLIGAYIINEYHNDWRYSMWVVAMIAAPIAIAALFMKETSKSRILRLREKKSSAKVARETGDTRLLLRKLRLAFIRPLHMMLIEPLVSYISIYTGFAFAMIFSFFGSYPYVFQTVYGFNSRHVGLSFLGVLVGFLLAVFIFGIFDATLYKNAVLRAPGGKPAPEHRLYAAMLGSILLPIGLFWWAWTPRESVHWMVPIAAGVPFGWGCLMIFMSSTTYLVDVYLAANAASALAANGVLRYGFGAIFPLFTLQMYTAMGIYWAVRMAPPIPALCCLLCFLTLSLIVPASAQTPSAEASAASSAILAAGIDSLSAVTDILGPPIIEAQSHYWSAANADLFPACAVFPSSVDEVSQIVAILQNSAGVNFAYSITLVSGRLGDVGVAGLTLGGGSSFLSSEYGLVCDNVINYEVVLANTTTVNANASSNINTYWALKGGRNQFAKFRKGTAYWKVPKDVSQGYDFNQYQETFFNAMSVFNLAGQQRTDRQVFYDHFQGGIGGMDLVEGLRDSVVRRVREATQKGTSAVTITITLDKEDDNKRIIFGALFVGFSDVGGIKKGEKYGKIREEILRLGKLVAYHDPTEWKVWPNPRI
ncbi:hypothetical protein B7494_g5538 [Chlorociboria aeruginascens]|nr:hypothetical protein B7494_g5538 [Chlorociboria aeruginascens]